MIPGCKSQLGRSDDTMDLIFLFPCLVLYGSCSLQLEDETTDNLVHELCYDSGALDEMAEQKQSFLKGKAN